nr:MAG: hypothetical protein [Tombusviridae sp.]
MDKGILSNQQTILVGLIECPLAADRGLKERARFYGIGQIVTALKMAWDWVGTCILWWVLSPFRFGLMLYRILDRFCCRVGRVLRHVKRSVCGMCRDTNDILKVTVNRRVRAFTGILLPVFVWWDGLWGLAFWTTCLTIYILCFVPRDFRDIITFRRKLERAWEDVLDESIESDLPAKNEEVRQVRKKERNSFACKVATMAISRVGLLKATKANALVYQKVVLDVLSDMNVRHVDRLQVLPVAVAACLDRPRSVDIVEGCIEHLIIDNPKFA